MSNYSKSLSKIIAFSADLLANLSIDSTPTNLYSPIHYILSNKGKRIRSVLGLLSYDMFGGNIRELKEIVLSIELLHNFTLIHDDIMDNAILRRGFETINKKWSNNQAILSGDALLIKSYQFLLDSELIDNSILKKFSKTAIEICEGQQLDFDFQFKKEIKENDYFKMIELKTGALIKFSVFIPSLLMNTTNKNRLIMNDIGICLGTLFQIQDDYLDLYGHQVKLGKVIGGDILEKKKTFLYVTALKNSNLKQKKKLINFYHSDEPNKVDKISSLYNDLDVKKDVQEIINKKYKDLLNMISAIEIPVQKKQLFLEFSKSIINRRF